MKQISFFALFLFFFIANSNAATVSGTVTNIVTGKPQPNMQVLIADSLGSPAYYASATTNSSGVYSFTLPASVSIGDKLTVVMSDSCYYYFSASYTYTGANIVHNFSACPGPTGPYFLTGRFSLPGATATTMRHFTAYIISMQYDPVIMDTTLTIVDSIVTSSIYPRFYKSYNSLPVGTLFVKVALNPLDSEYVNYLPTYYDSVLQWSSARALTLTNFTKPNRTDIVMKRGINPGGPGFIGGSVVLGANKSTAVGDPLNKRILILTNAATGQPVAYGYSDASGKFQFPNLAYGTYKIFGDAAGKKNPPLTVTLSAAQKSVSNIVFEENNKKFEGHFGNVGIGSVNSLPGVSVFPNPVTDFVRVQGLSSIGGEKTIVLSSMTCAEISRQTVSNDASISTATLPAGIYLLQVQTEAGSASFRIAK
jgi:hypothetical protein